MPRSMTPPKKLKTSTRFMLGGACPESEHPARRHLEWRSRREGFQVDAPRRQAVSLVRKVGRDHGATCKKQRRLRFEPDGKHVIVKLGPVARHGALGVRHLAPAGGNSIGVRDDEAVQRSREHPLAMAYLVDELLDALVSRADHGD